MRVLLAATLGVLPLLAAGAAQCREGHILCSTKYSVNRQGCCAFKDGVCCANNQTCCPAGSKCLDSGTYLTQCSDGAGDAVAGKSLCKFGPPFPMSSTLKNVVIIGDSVSIGYTPHVAKAIADIAFVQHSPWDTSDGGAEETAYGLQCLDYFLRSPAQVEISPDLLMFNFGLHDGPLGNSTIPGQSGNSSVYPEQLAEIADRLVEFTTRVGSQLVYALTTPVLCNASENGNVEVLNNHARAIMQKRRIPVLDPYSAIIGGCGTPPQPSCFGQAGCFCPHCPRGNASWPSGYEWLANTTLAPALRGMLA